MKLTNRPNVDDEQELQILANRANLGSYPALMHEYIAIRDQYRAFNNCNGDPWQLTPLRLNNGLSHAMENHYTKPPTSCLQFIANNRYKLSPIFCLMCGGFGMGDLDHYLPKAIYPEFLFFSANLVPACNCNSLRKTTVKGNTVLQRVIHPYFDGFVTDRLYQVKFRGEFETPHITIEAVNHNHPNIDTIEFHLDTVIRNSSTYGWLEKYWSELISRPVSFLKLVLPMSPTVVNLGNLTSALTTYRDSKDDEFDTPNNWYSMFYTGLLADTNRINELANVINRHRV